jgi:hypothetical protein
MAAGQLLSHGLLVQADSSRTQTSDPERPSLRDHLGREQAREQRSIRRHTAHRATRPPSIDGRLDDPEWQLTQPDNRFVQRFPKAGGEPSESTELRVLYDDEALYIAVMCRDRQPEAVVGRLSRRDRETDADKIEINISSANDGLSAYQFGVNASGVKVDGIRFNDTGYSDAWDEGVWDAAIFRNHEGWSAEVAIPFRVLRYDGTTTEFGLQVRRYIQRRGETTEWAPVARTAGVEVSGYGSLVGIDGLRARRLFYFLPYLTARLANRVNQGPLDGASPASAYGADLKFGITRALTLDATVNPDFGQVEADQVVLNLTTFETFRPEKRPFFMEGAELFATPFLQFYSRRVGRTPPSPALSESDLLLEPVRDNQILAAAKLAGRLRPRLTIAALDAVTSSVSAPIGASEETSRSVLLDPPTNFAALRLRQEFGRNSSVGVTSTAVDRFEPRRSIDLTTGRCAHGGAPDGQGRCHNDSYTSGLDLNLRSPSGTWGALAHVVSSLITHGPRRPRPDGAVLQPGSTGFGVQSELGKYGGSHWLGKLTYFGATPELYLDDAGYLRQSNIHVVGAVLTYRETEPARALLEWELSVQPRYDRSWDGAVLAKHIEASWWARWQPLWETFLRCEHNTPRLDNRETRDGAWTERPAWPGCQLDISTDTRRKVNVQFGGNVHPKWKGLEYLGYLNLKLRPSTQVEVDLLSRGSWTYGDPRWFRTINDPDGTRTYLFAELDSRLLDATLRGTYTFTPEISLQAYTQLFLASGQFGPTLTATTPAAAHPIIRLSSLAPMNLGQPPSFRDGALNVNLALRWEYRPGSTLYLVYVHAHQQTSLDPTTQLADLRLTGFKDAPYVDIVQLKASYLFQ